MRRFQLSLPGKGKSKQNAESSRRNLPHDQNRGGEFWSVIRPSDDPTLASLPLQDRLERILRQNSDNERGDKKVYFDEEKKVLTFESVTLKLGAKVQLGAINGGVGVDLRWTTQPSGDDTGLSELKKKQGKRIQITQESLQSTASRQLLFLIVDSSSRRLSIWHLNYLVRFILYDNAFRHLNISTDVLQRFDQSRVWDLQNLVWWFLEGCLAANVPRLLAITAMPQSTLREAQNTCRNYATNAATPRLNAAALWGVIRMLLNDTPEIIVRSTDQTYVVPFLAHASLSTGVAEYRCIDLRGADCNTWRKIVLGTPIKAFGANGCLDVNILNCSAPRIWHFGLVVRAMELSLLTSYMQVSCDSYITNATNAVDADNVRLRKKRPTFLASRADGVSLVIQHRADIRTENDECVPIYSVYASRESYQEITETQRTALSLAYNASYAPIGEARAESVTTYFQNGTFSKEFAWIM